VPGQQKLKNRQPEIAFRVARDAVADKLRGIRDVGVAIVFPLVKFGGNERWSRANNRIL
jgi:hypothetical protein